MGEPTRFVPRLWRGITNHPFISSAIGLGAVGSFQLFDTFWTALQWLDRLMAEVFGTPDWLPLFVEGPWFRILCAAIMAFGIWRLVLAVKRDGQRAQSARENAEREARALVLAHLRRAAVLPHLYAQREFLTAQISKLEQLRKSIEQAQANYTDVLQNAQSGKPKDRLAGSTSERLQIIRSSFESTVSSACDENRDFKEEYLKARPTLEEFTSSAENEVFISKVRHNADEVARIRRLLEATISSRREQLGEIGASMREELERLKSEPLYP